MCKIEFGIDTFSCYYKLTSGQKTKIIGYLKTKEGFRTQISNYMEDTYSYSSSYFKYDGIKIWIQRIKGNPWGLLIVVHPMLVLSNSDRSTLYQPEKKSDYKRMIGRVDKLLKTVNIPCSIDKMKFYRTDVTINLIFKDEAYVNEYLRVLKKSCLLPHYQPDWFREEGHKAKDCKIANKHSFKQYCKSAAFFSYDKTAQLEMIDAFPSTLIGKRVLRLETQLRRKGMKKWVGKDAMEGNNWNILKKLWKNCKKINQWYINRLQPGGVQYVRYEDAVRRVETIKGKKIRERMLYLLRKTSDSETLTAALEKLRKKYRLSRSQCRNVLKKFINLGISPITLTNISVYDCLPSVKTIIDK